MIFADRIHYLSKPPPHPWSGFMFIIVFVALPVHPGEHCMGFVIHFNSY